MTNLRKTAKGKECKICKGKFNPYSSLQVACSPKCALKVAEQKRLKQEKQELSDFRKRDKKLSAWIAEAQAAVNAYIRERDKYKPCISCGTMTSPQWDAGHYRSRGSAGHLRFNVLNNWKQCNKCNRFLGGNIVEYRKGLILRIGESRVIDLENDNEPRKFDREYCERVKKVFSKRKRHLSRLRAKTTPTQTAQTGV